MFDKFKIFKDNWEEIRDEVLSNGLDIFQNNPNCECTWGVAPNGVPVSLGFMLCIGNEPLEEHIKLFPKTWNAFPLVGLSYSVNPNTEPKEPGRFFASSSVGVC